MFRSQSPELQQRFKMGVLQCVSERQRCLSAWGKQDMNERNQEVPPFPLTYRENQICLCMKFQHKVFQLKSVP